MVDFIGWGKIICQQWGYNSIVCYSTTCVRNTPKKETGKAPALPVITT
jgi:hypothetical protein